MEIVFASSKFDRNDLQHFNNTQSPISKLSKNLANVDQTRPLQIDDILLLVMKLEIYLTYL